MDTEKVRYVPAADTHLAFNKPTIYVEVAASTASNEPERLLTAEDRALVTTMLHLTDAAYVQVGNRGWLSREQWFDVFSLDRN